MNYRFVKLIYPYKSKDGNLTRISSLKVHLKNKSNTIYNTVDQFENEIGSKIKKTIKEVKKLVLLITTTISKIRKPNYLKNYEKKVSRREKCIGYGLRNTWMKRSSGKSKKTSMLKTRTMEIIIYIRFSSEKILNSDEIAERNQLDIL